MTESNLPEAATPANSSSSEQSEALSIPEPTAGQLIRAQRIKLGVHLAVLSLQLKLPQRQLEALEADQHDLAKGPAFVRALASSVCRQLGMDPMPVLALLPQASIQMPLQRHPIGDLKAESATPSGLSTSVRALPLPTLGVAVVMLGLIAALLWMPSPSSWAWLQPKTEATASALTPSGSPGTSQLEQETPTSATEPAAVTPASATTTETPNAVVTPAQALTVAEPVPATDAILVFKANADTWLEIRDGKDRVQWSRLLRAGDKNEFQYPLPMRVVVGRSNAVTVTYRGQPFDLAPHTKVSVARFEVKE
jgi:cytoskeleton protein RodZ